MIGQAAALRNVYSASLRRMVTLNHDHLFAAVLRTFPLLGITEEDLRRRVFLLASQSLLPVDLHCHESLKGSQVDLLTDDRRHNYGNFLSYALEKEMVARRKGKLVKKRRDRLLAEEIMPLTDLLRAVRPVAWLPSPVLRHRIANYLERLGVQEFESDYSRFYRDNEGKEKGIGIPVLLEGRSRRVGVVLVHGFLSSPAQMSELALHLNSKGLWVYQVRLKGHGTSPEDLSQRTSTDWVESVDLGYALMKAICRSVVVGGFSFGGGVALDCASRVEDLAGVFAVCPPHRLVDISSRFVPAVTVWNKVMDALKYQWAKLEFVETVPERPQYNYVRLPVAGVRELGRFMKELEPKLSRIVTPVLVLQAEGDPVVDPRGSQQLFEMLGSPDKRYLKFPLKRHGILAGPGSAEVHAAIVSFIESVTRQSLKRD